jgi:hypothetical protein
VKKFELGLGHTKPVISLKRVYRLDEHWRVCCQEVEVGGLLRLLVLLQTSCLTLIDCYHVCTMAFNGANSCSRLTRGVGGEGGGIGGWNVP